MAKVYIITSEGGAGHKAAAEDSVKQLTSGDNPQYGAQDLETVFVMPPLQKRIFKFKKMNDNPPGIDEIQLDKDGNYKAYNASGDPFTGNVLEGLLEEDPLRKSFKKLSSNLKKSDFRDKILENLSKKGHAQKRQQKSWLQLFGIDVGVKGVEAWNSAQSSGNIKKTKRLVSQQWISEWLFGGTFRSNVSKYLKAHPDTELVVDTQAQNTHQILRAVSEYNQKTGKNVQFLKRMTDLPNKADHFFLSLNKIRDKDLPYLTLEVPHAPGVPKEDTEANLNYFRSKCPNLFDKEGSAKCRFTFTDGPIKQPFKDILEAKNKNQLEAFVPVQSDMSVPMKVKQNGKVVTQDFTVHNNATVKSIMLGSQAAVMATLAYVEAEVQAYTPQSNPEYLFVFCGNNTDLFNQVKEKADAAKQEYPNLTIVPLINQDAEMIAKVYGRAETVILRAGGISCMEIEAAARPGAKIFFHSEGQSDDEAVLADDLIPWEAGNIEHVKATLEHNHNTVNIIRPSMYAQKLAEHAPAAPVNVLPAAPAKVKAAIPKAPVMDLLVEPDAKVAREFPSKPKKL